MKTVFTNSMTAHVWAQQTQPKGRSNNSNLYFEGRTIYSYGRHFPIASYITDDIILLNSDRYSSSTGKHQSYVRRAISDDKKRYQFNTNVMQCAAMWDMASDENGLLIATVIREALKEAENKLKEGAAKRLHRLKDAALMGAINALQYARDFVETMGGNAGVLIEKQNELTLHGGERMQSIAQAFKDEKERRAKAQAEIEKERAEQLKNIIPLWRSDSDITYSERSILIASKKIYLRLIGGNVETSKGATFPIEHARKAFNFIRDAKQKQRQFTPNSALPAPRLGHFKIDLVDSKGNVKAGCHFVEYDEIETIAKQLGIA